MAAAHIFCRYDLAGVVEAVPKQQADEMKLERRDIWNASKKQLRYP
jgi:hypothetical protein